MRGRSSIASVARVGVVAVSLQGCAAIPLAVVAGSLLEAGGGVLVKTGTEYTASGTVRRTFMVPIDDVHAAAVDVLRNAEIVVVRDTAAPKRHRITGVMQGRKLCVDLLPLTPILTSMEVSVKRNVFASDKATASEIVSQTRRLLDARAKLAAAATPAPPVPTPTPARRVRHR
jgi:hypothetical protein